MILDTRQYRVDDLLRQPYGAGTPFGPSGETLWAGSPQGWGFRGSVFRGRCAATPVNALAPLYLTIAADGEEVEVGDAIARPSHVTLHGLHSASGLQVTEDKFISPDDVLVSVVSLRNPSEAVVDIQIDAEWGIRQGEQAALGEGPVCWVRREAPPGDDLLQRLPGGARRTLVFAIAVAPSREQALARAAFWQTHPDPVRAQAEAYQGWFDENVPRFDCPDPWLTKLWYHAWQSLRRLRGETKAVRDAVRRLSRDAEAGDVAAALAAFARSQFTEGDFGRPGLPDEHAAGRADADEAASPALAEFLIRDIFRVSAVDPDTLAVQPRVSGWSHFCLDGLVAQDRAVTLVWDDPADPSVDAYHDGDKGFTVYADGRRVRHLADLAPLEAALPL